MRIAEIFRSIQGEGRLTGMESVFVRVSGCNLRCRYCDTPYASWTPEGEDLSVDEILDRVEELRDSPSPSFLTPIRAAGHVASSSVGPVRHIVLTGGEPMLFAELIPLTIRLRDQQWSMTIETSGTLYLPVACDLMSISPKLSNSTPSPEQAPRWASRHEYNRHASDVIRRLIAEYDYQLKFVIDSPEDCREIDAYLAAFPEIQRNRVMFMPQGTDADALAKKGAWLESYCAAEGFLYCPRRQVEWFGTRRGR